MNDLPNNEEIDRAMSAYIGNQLRSARLSAGLSQQEAARLMGYSNGSRLSKIEKGHYCKLIPYWIIKRAADLYNVPVSFLTGGGENPAPEEAHHKKSNADPDEPLKALIKVRDELVELVKRGDVGGGRCLEGVIGIAEAGIKKAEAS